MKISIIGLGWFGLPLARALSDLHEVSGSKTSEDDAGKIRKEGIRAFPLTLNPGWMASAEAESALCEVDATVINIPPSRSSDVPERFYAGQMEELEQRLKRGGVKHIVFVSSTGVFGEDQHRCDEDTEPVPTRSAGKVLLSAEQFFRERFSGKVSIMRPGGLVGPDRFPGRFLAGRTGLSGKNHPVNLVHLNDLIALTRSILENDLDRTVFHAVAKDHPSKQDFYTKASEALGLRAPEFDPSDESIGKFISAEKSKKSTAVKFSYDDPIEMVKGQGT